LITRYIAGAEEAVDNASALFDVAERCAGSAAAPASFIASIAAEELGKAILLWRRATALVLNAEARMHALEFPGDSTLSKPTLRPVPPWTDFEKKNKQGCLRHHATKLEALSDYYADVHPHVTRQGDTLLVSTIDVLAGKGGRAVRSSVEESLYISWDESIGAWHAPRPCIASIDSFVSQMRDVVESLRERVTKPLGGLEGHLKYVVSTVEARGLDTAAVFEEETSH